MTAHGRMRTVKDCTIDVLGKPWTIYIRTEEQDNLLKEMDGYTDWTQRRIVVSAIDGTLRDMEAYRRKVTRHEIVHAFLFEVGLAEASAPAEAWAHNEEMVDWFAKMGPRIFAAWQEAGAME